jgi:hypothetical protein
MDPRHNPFKNNIYRYQEAAYFPQNSSVLPNDTLAKPKIEIYCSAAHLGINLMESEGEREGDISIDY